MDGRPNRRNIAAVFSNFSKVVWKGPSTFCRLPITFLLIRVCINKDRVFLAFFQIKKISHKELRPREKPVLNVRAAFVSLFP